MTPIVFGSLEASAILKKDRPLRKEAEREARIEKARCEGKVSRWEVYIEGFPPPERSVIVEAYSQEEAWQVIERDRLNTGEVISGTVRVDK